MARPSAPERREQIVAAALELFRRNGFAAVSTRDLAEHAGLSRSHVYHYFSDWKALRRAAFERFSAEQVAEVRELLAGLAPAQALRRFCRECLPLEREAAWALWLDAWDEALHEEAFAVAYQQAIECWQLLLEELLSAGVAAGAWRCAEPARAARQLLALLNGYADDLLLQPSAGAEQALDEVLEVARLLLGASLD